MDETREFRCAIEVRVDASRLSPGRLFGTLLTYGEMASDRNEVFEQGSLTWPDDGIIINRAHAQNWPVLRAVPSVRGNAVVLDVPLPDTVAGRDSASEIRGGLLRGLSVEFLAKKQRFEGGVRRISAAVLTGAGLVSAPAYKGSSLEVRGKGRRRHIWL